MKTWNENCFCSFFLILGCALSLSYSIAARAEEAIPSIGGSSSTENLVMIGNALLIAGGDGKGPFAIGYDENGDGQITSDEAHDYYSTFPFIHSQAVLDKTRCLKNSCGGSCAVKYPLFKKTCECITVVAGVEVPCDDPIAKY